MKNSNIRIQRKIPFDTGNLVNVDNLNRIYSDVRSFDTRWPCVVDIHPLLKINCFTANHKTWCMYACMKTEYVSSIQHEPILNEIGETQNPIS